MASIFELGVTREQGRAGRCQLLRRETLLRCLAEQLLGAPVAAGASGRAALEQLRDEQLAEATRAQLADAAEAAAGASYVAAAATADEVGDCVMDVFVMRRCGARRGAASRDCACGAATVHVAHSHTRASTGGACGALARVRRSLVHPCCCPPPRLIAGACS